MQSYPCGAQISTINRLRTVRDYSDWVSQSLRSRKGHRNTPPFSPLEPLSHHGGTRQDGQDLCRKGAGDLRGPRGRGGDNSDDARPRGRRQSPNAIIGRLRRPKRASISRVRGRGCVVYGQQGRPPVNQLVHVVGRGDAQRGAYRREGDGAHRRGGRGRGSHYASSLLHFSRR